MKVLVEINDINSVNNVALTIETMLNNIEVKAC